MKLRLWPRSLLGQMLLSVAGALLIAQGISGALLWRAEEQRRETARDRHRHRHQESLVRYQRTYSVKSVHTATAVIQADSPA